MYTIIFLIRGIVAQTKLFYHLHNADAEFDRLAASLIPEYADTASTIEDIYARISYAQDILNKEGKDIVYSREKSKPADTETTYVLTGDLSAELYSEGGIAAVLKEIPHQSFGLTSYDTDSHPEDIMDITLGQTAFQVIDKWEFELLSAIIHCAHCSWDTVKEILDKSRELELGISLDNSGIEDPERHLYYFENRVFYPLI